MNTLLLTSCICPKNVINKKDNLIRKEREKQYEWALKYYIEKSNFDYIVFVDNSNYILEYVQKLPKKTNSELIYINWKTLEYIKFDWNKHSNKYWYGYWDQECMDYAFENSIILNNLKNNESFFKISGRYVLPNINSIIKKTQSIENMFLKSPIKLFNIQTAIVKISKSNYNKYIFKRAKAFFESWNNDNLSFLLENIRYIMLRSIVHQNKIWKRIYNIYHQYDWKLIFRWPNFPLLAKISYFVLDFFMFNQYLNIFYIADKLFFNKWYDRKTKKNN